jgi:hypothetical protein
MSERIDQWTGLMADLTLEATAEQCPMTNLHRTGAQTLELGGNVRL